MVVCRRHVSFWRINVSSFEAKTAAVGRVLQFTLRNNDLAGFGKSLTASDIDMGSSMEENKNAHFGPGKIINIGTS